MSCGLRLSKKTASWGTWQTFEVFVLCGYFVRTLGYLVCTGIQDTHVLGAVVFLEPYPNTIFRSQCNLELLVSFRTSFAIRQAKRKYCTWKASVTWWQWIHAHRWVLTASFALAAVVLILHVRYKEQLARRNILRHPEDSLPHSATRWESTRDSCDQPLCTKPIMSYREAAAGTTHPTFQSGRL